MLTKCYNIAVNLVCHKTILRTYLRTFQELHLTVKMYIVIYCMNFLPKKIFMNPGSILKVFLRSAASSLPCFRNTMMRVCSDNEFTRRTCFSYSHHRDLLH